MLSNGISEYINGIDISHSTFKHVIQYYVFRGRNWNSISAIAKELVKSLLRTDPPKRLSVTEACSHEWIMTDDGDTHVPPLENPILQKKKAFNEHHQQEQVGHKNGSTPWTSTKAPSNNHQSAPQSIVGSPSVDNKIQRILNSDLSPPGVKSTPQSALSSNVYFNQSFRQSSDMPIFHLQRQVIQIESGFKSS